MKTVKNILLVVIVFFAGFIHGCGIVNGAGNDIAWLGNGIATLTTPAVDAEDKMTDDMVAKQKQHDLDKATAIVIKNHEKTSSGVNNQ